MIFEEKKKVTVEKKISITKVTLCVTPVNIPSK